MPGHLVHRIWQHNPTLPAPPRYKRACGYDAFVPQTLATLNLRLSAELAGAFSEAEGTIRALNTNSGPSLAPLARLLLRTESIASSKVEGLQLDARQLARSEAKAESGGKASPTALEILANIDAMSLAVEEASLVEPFTVAEIRSIHERVMAHAPNKQLGGQLRTRQNWIGGNDWNPCGADFVPPPPEDVERLLADLCVAINDERLPPLVQAALVHAQFETIHPFADGNGRTGRALVQVVLRRRGLAPSFVPPISVALASAREKYIAGLTDFRGDGVERWLEHFAQAASRATWIAQAYMNAIGELRTRWHAQLAASPGAPRRDAAAWAVIDILPAHPIITAPVATAVTGRNKMAIYQAFELLTAAGVVTAVTASRRNRAWEAVGLLELIAGLEAGRVPQSD